MDLKKAKKQGHCYSKREKAAGLLLFLNNNDPVFCNLQFAPHILDQIFSKFQTLKKSGRPDKSDIRVQIHWSNIDVVL